ncbi:MAG: hypothetical protein K6T59_07540, partial [Bryobacteraceae bacterium]|nr:hypothetical protein [Bryobacteraceae bacterium]
MWARSLFLLVTVVASMGLFGGGPRCLSTEAGPLEAGPTPPSAASDPPGQESTGEEEPPRLHDQHALADLQALIGGWKGVGQPTRGSARGAWAEECQWAWSFEQGRAAVVFSAKGGRYFAAGRIVAGAEPGELLLYLRLPGPVDVENIATPHDAQPNPSSQPGANAQPGADAQPGAEEPPGSLLQAPEGAGVIYRGGLAEDRWVFTRVEDGSVPVSEGKPADARAAPARISLRLVADGKRLVVLLERRLGPSERFVRLAEIGYTRKGSRFGAGGLGGPECIVTGGLGTIAVEYQGRTYYVCCTGC